MSSTLAAASANVYSAAEIATAAGASKAQVVAAMGGAVRYVGHFEAVSIAKALRLARVERSAHPFLFSLFISPRISSVNGSGDMPLAVASALHAAFVLMLIVIGSWRNTPTAAGLAATVPVTDAPRLVFLATPGPGGGGGGGGLRQRTPAPAALLEGHHSVPSPVVVSTPKPAPLQAEPLPVILAPVVTQAADARTRIGVVEQTTAEVESQGPGTAGGVGAGQGTGLGSGEGNGIGPGSGGGTGGGPYRGGSGVEPPRLLREVKADYTEEARQRGVSGDVELEIVVRRGGSVGDVRVLRGLVAGLNERAVEAVRQWRFSPAHRLGIAVDVIVEVAVEFKLR